jgi:hypothetical protein
MYSVNLYDNLKQILLLFALSQQNVIDLYEQAKQHQGVLVDVYGMLLLECPLA